MEKVLSGENHIEFKNVSVSYDGEKNVIDDVSISIKRGEFTTILGPSGCGKSTLLRMIGGFVTPTSGQVLLDGKDISKIPPYERPVNMVFQNYALFPHLNVFENIAFGLRMQKIPRSEMDARVKEVLKIVDLEGFEKRSVKTLSGGQQQRIAIARAIVNKPEVLLLDESLSALDHKMRVEMQLELKTMHKQLGITFVFVTHDQEEALTMSDKVIVIADGVIQQQGTPEEIYNEPRNLFVADFIGQCNIFEGTMADKMLVDFEGTKLECVDDYEIGKWVNIIIRPEDVEIVPPGEGQITGTVISADFKGIFYVTTIEFGNFEMEVHTLKHLLPGAEVGMYIPADMIHLIPLDESDSSLEGTITELSEELCHIAFKDFEIDIDPRVALASQKYTVGTRVEVFYEPVDGILSDDIDEGLFSGTIVSFVYLGDRYSYTVRTKSRNYAVDDPDLWNIGDMVSISIPLDKMQFTVLEEG